MTKDQLVERLAFELWRAITNRREATFEQWRRIWATGKNAIDYRRGARRMLELLSDGKNPASLAMLALAAESQGLTTEDVNAVLRDFVAANPGGQVAALLKREGPHVSELELPETFNRFLVTVHEGRIVIGAARLAMDERAALNLMAWLAVALSMVSQEHEGGGGVDAELTVTLARVRAMVEKIWQA